MSHFMKLYLFQKDRLMARLTQQIAALISEIDHPEMTHTDEGFLLKSLEKHFIVLEGLVLCADEMGVYQTAGKHSDTIYSEALKKHASKWIHAADALSEGQSDIRSDDITDSLAWESLGLESIDIKHVIEKIWAIIKRVVKEIGLFIKDFFDFSDIWIQKTDMEIERAQKLLDSVKREGKKPPKEKIALPSAAADLFFYSHETPTHALSIVQGLNVTNHASEAIVREYLKMIEESNDDVSKTLGTAFEYQFENQQRNNDLIRALEVFKPSKIADAIGHTSADIGREKDISVVTRISPALLKGSHLIYIEGKHLSGSGGDREDIRRLSECLKSEILLGSKESTGNQTHLEIEALSLPEIDELLRSAKSIIAKAEESHKHLKSLQNAQKKLDAVINECHNDAEKNPDKYTPQSMQLLLKISIGTHKRIVKPAVPLQKLALQGAHVAVALCEQHLRLYK